MRRIPLTREQRAARDAAHEQHMEDINLGYALRRQMQRARQRKGLTQQQLADKMGTSQPAIARLEAGCRIPTLATLQKLAWATGSRLVFRLEEEVAVRDSAPGGGLLAGAEFDPSPLES